MAMVPESGNPIPDQRDPDTIEATPMPRSYPFAALVLAATSLAAGIIDPIDPFEPNCLFVVSSDSLVFEFTEDGTLVPNFLTGLNALTGLDAAQDVAFGPDGALYATDFELDRVLVFDASGGAAKAIIGADSTLEDPSDLTFGPDGDLYVASSANDLVMRFGRDGLFDSAIGAGSPLSNPRGVTIGPDGHLYVSSFDTDEVVEFDATGTYIGSITDPGMSQPFGLTFGPRGNLFVSSFGTGRVCEFDAAGNVVGTIGAGTALSSPTALEFGPDGNLYVASQGTDNVMVFNDNGLLVGTIGSTSSLSGPSGLAFSPFVIGANLSGRIEQLGGDQIKVKSKARLSYSPGTGRATLLLTETDDELTAAFGSDVLTFTGFEGSEDDTDKDRSFVGQQVSGSGLSDGLGALGIELRGKVDEDTGRYEVKKFKGTLHRAGPFGVIDAKVKSSNKLP